jgi:hypothetical protein
MLNLIDDDGAAQIFQCSHRLIESRETGRILEVKVVARAERFDLSCQSRFAALTRANERHHAAAFQRLPDLGKKLFPFDHDLILP